jgi:hypothetical protein
MSPTELEQLLKNYLESNYRLTLDYFAIEGKMAPDANGDMGVTGNYRKAAGSKNVFFTVTVNLTSREVKNLQEY